MAETRRRLRVMSGVAAIAVAVRVGGWRSAGLAALGGWLLGRRLARPGLRRSMAEYTPESIDPVDLAGEESFPASDPPSWSPTAS
jgi:hypothetical protein